MVGGDNGGENVAAASGAENQIPINRREEVKSVPECSFSRHSIALIYCGL